MIVPKLIVFDFDGVFTDNAVYVAEDGTETVRCSREDSLGINMLQARGLPMFILSTESNAVVTARAKKMKLNAFQDCRNKREFLEDYFAQHNLPPQEVLYMGNDLNDQEAMRLVGFSVCPADAHETIRGYCDLVLSRKGGHGAVRELCELLVMALEKENVCEPFEERECPTG